MWASHKTTKEKVSVSRCYSYFAGSNSSLRRSQGSISSSRLRLVVVYSVTSVISEAFSGIISRSSSSFQAIPHLLDADIRLLHGLLRRASRRFCCLLVLGVAGDFGSGFIVLRGFLWSVERGAWVKGVALSSSFRVGSLLRLEEVVDATEGAHAPFRLELIDLRNEAVEELTVVGRR